jgi:uncharacterized protein (TIGR00725 family)
VTLNEMRASLYVAVAGRWKGEEDTVLSLAERSGEALAARGHVVLTGGGPGVMEAVCRGAKRCGGTTIGFLGGMDRSEANPFVDHALPTGLGWELRSQLMVRSCDVLLLVGGGAGSLAEVIAAYAHKKPVVMLRGSGGWADRLSDVLVEGKYVDERRGVEVVLGRTPQECVELASALGDGARRERLARKGDS